MQPDDTSMADNDAPADPLRLDRCPDCGYLLTGLPEQGICPECGFAYRADMIVLYGWGRGKQADLTNTRGWRMVALGLLYTINALQILLPVGLMLAFRRDWRGIWLVGVCAVLAWGAVRHWRRNRSDAPAPVQVRLYPHGYAQRNGIGPVKLRPWRRNVQLCIHKSSNKTYQVFHRLSFWSVPRRMISMEFDCDARTAERIQERIQQWCRQSRY